MGMSKKMTNCFMDALFKQDFSILLDSPHANYLGFWGKNMVLNNKMLVSDIPILFQSPKTAGLHFDTFETAQPVQELVIHRRMWEIHLFCAT